ncbi:MAG: LacI family DNA-binding transcriptional regulator [Puniceicoccales bacterium]
MPQRVSMRELAAEAGVSVMTVSLALRNSPKLSEATRSRIQNLAQQRGYRPDPALRALADYRLGKRQRSYSGTIAYLRNTPPDAITHSVSLHRHLYQGAKRRGEKLGLKVEDFAIADYVKDSDRLSKILLARGIQGLLVGPQPRSHTHLELDWEKFSAVALGYSLESPSLNVVIDNQFNASLICMRELCKLGYQRVGFVILTDQDERSTHRYVGAYHSAQENLPPDCPRLPILRGSVITEEAFNRWFDENRPDALLSLHDTVIGYMEKRGIRIPEDIGYAVPFSVETLDHMAHADGRPEEVGVAAVEMLSGMIDRNDKGIPPIPRNLIIDPLWVPSQSVRQVGPPIHI